MRGVVQIAISTHRNGNVAGEKQRGVGAQWGDFPTRARRQLDGGNAVACIKGHPVEGRSRNMGQGAVRV